MPEKEIYSRLNKAERELTGHDVKIETLEKDMIEIKDKCEDHPEICPVPTFVKRLSSVETKITGTGTSLDTLKKYILPILAVGNVILNLIAVGVLAIILFGIKSDVAYNAGKFDAFMEEYIKTIKEESSITAAFSIKIDNLEKRMESIEELMNKHTRKGH